MTRLCHRDTWHGMTANGWILIIRKRCQPPCQKTISNEKNNYPRLKITRDFSVFLDFPEESSGKANSIIRLDRAFLFFVRRKSVDKSTSCKN